MNTPPTSRYGEGDDGLGNPIGTTYEIPWEGGHHSFVTSTTYRALLMEQSALSETQARIPNIDHLTVQELQALHGLVNMLLQHKVCGNPVEGVIFEPRR